MGIKTLLSILVIRNITLVLIVEGTTEQWKDFIVHAGLTDTEIQKAIEAVKRDKFVITKTKNIEE
jgi:hypothetical protein